MMLLHKSLTALATMALVLSVSLDVSAQTVPRTERVSVASDGTQGNGRSETNGFDPRAMSADGSSVAFHSAASNLVSGDTNDVLDIFVHDHLTGETERVSVDSSGGQANGPSFLASISADGRYVAFQSRAANLLPDEIGDRDQWDIFVHDRETGETEVVSLASDGTQANNTSRMPSISADGRYVAFHSVATDLVPGSSIGGIFVHDRETGLTERIDVTSGGGEPDAAGFSPSISNDGSTVAFWSGATDLVPGDTNGKQDIFVRDRVNGTTERVSVDSSGEQANGGSAHPSISADGSTVAFWSQATNLVPSDTNGVQDVFVRDRVNGTTERVSVDSSGEQVSGFAANPAISPDGRYVAFDSNAPGLAANKVDFGVDVFRHDRQTGETILISVNESGEGGNDNSRFPSLSGNGQVVAFTSDATDLVTPDDNGGGHSGRDVYVRVLAEVNQAPVADAGDDQRVHVWNTASLDGSGSFDPDGHVPLSFQWEITSAPAESSATLSDPTDVSPSLTPDEEGTYAIQLVVTDSLGAESGADEVLIDTFNTAPVADAGEDQLVVTLGTEVQLDGSQSFDNEGDPISFAWTLMERPDDSQATLDDPTRAKPTFVADVHGEYRARLVVTDTFGAESEPDFVMVSFENVEPVADAGPNRVVQVQEEAVLDGSGSHDANLDPLTYQWEITAQPEDSFATLTGSTSATPSLTPDVAGEYIVSLTVNDGFADSEPDSATVSAVRLSELIETTLQDAIAATDALPDSDLKNPRLRKALTNKMAASARLADRYLISEAVNELENDVLAKTDCCANEDAPDRNDWITNCYAQGQVYRIIVEMIDLIR